ncbi:MAG: hypothetical protein JXM70_23080 [Pirellulales bacterium]|nr:hypothetical protein [Pirellulales bacterium]
MIVTTICAVCFSVAGMAVRGNEWAVGISAGVVSLVVLAICGTGLFTVVWITSACLNRFRGEKKSSQSAVLGKVPGDGKPTDSPFAPSPSAESLPPKNPPGGTLCLFFLIITFLGAQLARAQQIEPWRISGENLVVNGAGLSMTVDSRWMTCGGYRPVRITFTAAAPLKADRSLTVDIITSSNWYRGSSQLTVTEDFKIPAGSTRISKVVSLPEIATWDTFKVLVYEDEELVKPLSNLQFNPSRRTAGNWQYNQVWGETPGILFVGDKLPDTNELSLHFGSPVNLQGQGVPVPQVTMGGGMGVGMGMGVAKTNLKVPLPSALAVPSAKLPPRWIDYTGLDVVCLSLKQLSDLKNKQPEVFGAITAWTASGGNLWIYGVGAKWERIDELHRLLEMPKTDTKKDPTTGWTKPQAELFGHEMKKEQSGRYSGGIYGRRRIISAYDQYTPQPNRSRKAPKTPADPHFVFRDFDMGMIVALKDDKPFPGTRWQWGWLLSATGQNRWNWDQRHGVSIYGDNGYFLNFRIPGVGLAPVGAFRVLLTFFVLAIGPLNYIALKRIRRLNLLVVTIPAGAILVTAGLFAYAVVDDGFSTRVRMRSATVIDQHRDRAVCWNRLCYYAGMAPSRGLTFPDDVAVIPIESPASINSRHVRALYWDEEQWMHKGWLDARTLTQFLTLRSRPCTAGLEISPSPNGVKEIEVKNNLGTSIELLVVRMSDGKYYWVSDVEQDAIVSASEVTQTEAFARLEQRALEEKPRYPEGMRNLRRYYPGVNVSNVSDNSLLERKLTCRSLSPCSYVAIVDRSPEVVVGGPYSFKDVDSFHVIFGTWRVEAAK